MIQFSKIIVRYRQNWFIGLWIFFGQTLVYRQNLLVHYFTLTKTLSYIIQHSKIII